MTFSAASVQKPSTARIWADVAFVGIVMRTARQPTDPTHRRKPSVNAAVAFRYDCPPVR